MLIVSAYEIGPPLVASKVPIVNLAGKAVISSMLMVISTILTLYTVMVETDLDEMTTDRLLVNLSMCNYMLSSYVDPRLTSIPVMEAYVLTVPIVLMG